MSRRFRNEIREEVACSFHKIKLSLDQAVHCKCLAPKIAFKSMHGQNRDFWFTVTKSSREHTKKNGSRQLYDCN